jgi:hypothetical protein
VERLLESYLGPRPSGAWGRSARRAAAAQDGLRRRLLFDEEPDVALHAREMAGRRGRAAAPRPRAAAAAATEVKAEAGAEAAVCQEVGAPRGRTLMEAVLGGHGEDEEAAAAAAAHDAMAEAPTPRGLTSELMLHQRMGLAWMLRRERAGAPTTLFWERVPREGGGADVWLNTLTGEQRAIDDPPYGARPAPAPAPLDELFLVGKCHFPKQKEDPAGLALSFRKVSGGPQGRVALSAECAACPPPPPSLPY